MAVTAGATFPTPYSHYPQTLCPIVLTYEVDSDFCPGNTSAKFCKSVLILTQVIHRCKRRLQEKRKKNTVSPRCTSSCLQRPMSQAGFSLPSVLRYCPHPPTLSSLTVYPRFNTYEYTHRVATQFSQGLLYVINYYLLLLLLPRVWFTHCIIAIKQLFSSLCLEFYVLISNVPIFGGKILCNLNRSVVQAVSVGEQIFTIRILPPMFDTLYQWQGCPTCGTHLIRLMLPAARELLRLNIT